MGDRMTALDAAFYHLERTGQLLHVGSICLFEGPLDYERTLADLSARLHLIPRYTQRVVPVPFNLGNPTWEPARGFDVRQHVVRHTLRPPGDDEQLRSLASRLFAEPLDRSRPLWEMHQIDGWRGDRSALLAKVHHCMIDGVSGVQLLGVLLDVTPTPAPPPAAPEAPAPAPPPTPSEQALQAVLEGTTSAVEGARALRALLRRPGDAWHELREAVHVMGEGVRLMFEPVPPTPFNGFVGTLRRIEWLTLDLHQVKAVKNRLGGTVNDVVLAILSGALRRFLYRRGASVEGLDFRVMIPVNVRAAEEQREMGNRVAMLVVHLPLDEADAHARMMRVIAETQRMKQSQQAAGVRAIEELSNQLFTALFTEFGRLAAYTHPFNLVVTNVPGPQMPVYIEGAKMLACYPLVPLFRNQALGVALFSYDGRLYWGFNADWDALPDLHELVTAVDAEFRAMTGS